jgi:hypothetical protein
MTGEALRRRFFSMILSHAVAITEPLDQKSPHGPWCAHSLTP